MIKNNNYDNDDDDDDLKHNKVNNIIKPTDNGTQCVVCLLIYVYQYMSTDILYVYTTYVYQYVY